jgi:hydroxypyruvate isomerase
MVCSFIPLEEMAAWIRSIGVGAIDLLSPKEWNVLKKYNLHCSMCYTDGKISLTEGWNRKEHHSWLVDDFTKYSMVKEAGFTNLICFSGNRKGMDDETGMNNCVEGLKK